MLLSEASDDHILSRRMKLCFNLVYSISYAHYRDIFQDVPEDVIDTLNKRSNVRHLPHWTTDNLWFLHFCLPTRLTQQ
jgi:hypothetical protein